MCSIFFSRWKPFFKNTVTLFKSLINSCTAQAQNMLCFCHLVVNVIHYD